jgi:hypothetical protein
MATALPGFGFRFPLRIERWSITGDAAAFRGAAILRSSSAGGPLLAALPGDGTWPIPTVAYLTHRGLNVGGVKRKPSGGPSRQHLDHSVRFQLAIFTRSARLAGRGQ